MGSPGVLGSLDICFSLYTYVWTTYNGGGTACTFLKFSPSMTSKGRWPDLGGYSWRQIPNKYIQSDWNNTWNLSKYINYNRTQLLSYVYYSCIPSYYCPSTRHIAGFVGVTGSVRWSIGRRLYMFLNHLRESIKLYSPCSSSFFPQQPVKWTHCKSISRYYPASVLKNGGFPKTRLLSDSNDHNYWPFWTAFQVILCTGNSSPTETPDWHCRGRIILGHFASSSVFQHYE